MTDEEESATESDDADTEAAADWPLKESEEPPSGPAERVPQDMDPTDEPFGEAIDRVQSDEGYSSEQTDVGAGPSLGARESPDEPAERSGPMSDLAAEVKQRREASADSSEHFDQEGVETVDPDVVWEQLQDDDPIEASTEEARERTEEVIDAGKFCQRCEYFTDPPEVHCTHEGTDIVELVDVEQFRVLGCPKVEEEKQLEDL
jgi:hypothetical protein